jgi:hypothetical protein
VSARRERERGRTGGQDIPSVHPRPNVPAIGRMLDGTGGKEGAAAALSLSHSVCLSRASRGLARVAPIKPAFLAWTKSAVAVQSSPPKASVVVSGSLPDYCCLLLVLYSSGIQSPPHFDRKTQCATYD